MSNNLYWFYNRKDQANIVANTFYFGLRPIQGLPINGLFRKRDIHILPFCATNIKGLLNLDWHAI